MDKRTITIVVDESELKDAMRHLSSNRPGKPLVAIQHLIAVDGDEGYDLNEFEEAPSTRTDKGVEVPMRWRAKSESKDEASDLHKLEGEDAKVGHDYKSIMSRKTGVSVEQLDKEEREIKREHLITDEDDDPRVVRLWMEHHNEGRRLFGEKRWTNVNFGWVQTENSISSKVYGKEPRVLISTCEGDTIKHEVKDYK